MNYLRQLGLLLWKNFTLRRRQPVRVFVEFTWPLVLFVILMAVRLKDADMDTKDNIETCFYYPRALPSAGALAFAQSYVCRFEEMCIRRGDVMNPPGIINNFNSSLLDMAFQDVERVLSSGTSILEVENLLKDLDTLSKFISVAQDGSDETEEILLSLSDLFLNHSKVNEHVTNQSIGLTPESVEALEDGQINLSKLLSDADNVGLTELALITEIVQDLQNDDQSAAVADTKELVCEDEFLLKYFEFKDSDRVQELQKEICSLPDEELLLLAEVIAENIDSDGVMKEFQTVVKDVTGQDLSLSVALHDLSILGNINLLSMSLEAGTDADDIGKLLCGDGYKPFEVPNYLLKEFKRTQEKDTSKEDSTTISVRIEEARERIKRKGLAPECADLFESFEANTVTRIIWNELKPIVIGVIPYAPDSPAARKIINEAKKFFDYFKSLSNLILDIEDGLPEFFNKYSSELTPLVDFFQSDSCKNVVKLVNTPGMLSYIGSLLEGIPFDGISPDLCKTALSLLDNSQPEDPSLDPSDIEAAINWDEVSNETKSIFDKVEPYLKCFKFDKFVGYETAEELEQKSLHLIGNKTLLAGIVFENIGKDDVEIPTTVKYKLRLDWERGQSTRVIRDYIKRPTSGTGGKHYQSWFLPLQDMLDHAIIKLHTNSSQIPGVYNQRFPYPCYINAWFANSFAETLPLFMALSWLFTVATVIKGIVYERETRLKEVMRIMGLGNGVHWIAWFITSFIMMFTSASIICIMLKGGLVLERANASVIMLFMVSVVASTISECFLISVFFDKANLAAVCGGFIFFILYLPYTAFVQNIDTAPTWVLRMACLSPNIAMGFGCYFMAINEEQSVGAQWSNWGTSPVVDGTFCLQDCIEMMFLDTIIFFIIAWYYEIVFPGQYGMPRKPWFFLQRSYWCGTSSDNVSKIRAGSEMAVDDLGEQGGKFEAPPGNLQIGVAVRNLTKLYSQNKLAVDGLSLDFYKGQITSFLGHNGAGKTTTMSILTGLFPPTSGTAFIDGLDILTDFNTIRSSLGMCPQHNVLFDLLTVEEHIWFYARLKGRSNSEVTAELDMMLQDIGLPHKRNEKSMNLSGGMKRKLSVAIAFVGGSQTVILDEPTAGVDPYARRAIWELLLKLKKGRTIILSTHHMDEADVLGDRIAIIAQGKLCTVGSSLFLKNKFGSGYYLTLVRADSHNSMSLSNGKVNELPSEQAESRNVEDVKVEMADGEKPEMENEKVKYLSVDTAGETSGPVLLNFLRRFAPDVELVEDNRMEICFRIPQSDGGKPRHLQDMFEALEASHESLGISSYGISDTTLEEVFLRVADENAGDEVKRSRLEETTDNGLYPQRVSFKNSIYGRARRTLSKITARYRASSMRRFFNDDDQSEMGENNSYCEGTETTYGPSVSLTGKLLVLQQIWSILIKRFIHVCRSKKGFVCEILLPAAFVCIAMISTLVLPDFAEDPPLEMQPWMYEPKRGSDSLYTFYSNDNTSDSIANGVENELRSKPYYGTRCMDPAYHVIRHKECRGPDFGSKNWSPFHQWNESTPHCNCDKGYQVCPPDLPEPSERSLRNNDHFLNLTTWNVSEWLVETKENYEDIRMGGFSVGEKFKLPLLKTEDVHDAVKQVFASAQDIAGTPSFSWSDIETIVKGGYTEENVLVWQNSRGYMTSPAYMSAMNNAILRSLLPAHADKSKYGIVTIDHPIKFSREQLSDQGLYQNGLVNLVVAVCVIFAMSFIPASFVLYLIEERVTKSKHLQFVSGTNPIVYWLANWFWDMINYTLPCVLCILIFIMFDQRAYVSHKNLSCLVALLFLYGWAIIPMMYPFSRLFQVPSTAFVTLSCMNVFLGTISTLATFILETMTNDKELADINDILKKVFLILPHFCLGRGLMDMAGYDLNSQVIARYGETLEYSLFEWDIVGRNLFALFTIGVFFIILNFFHEYNFFLGGIFSRKEAPKGSAKLDEDVSMEKDRVCSGLAENDVLRLAGLTKVYQSPSKSQTDLLAVDRIYLGVPKGQCFGLLGVNGAGKSSLFKMLTGDISITEGEAYICDNSITANMQQARQYMGYCPQVDALDPLLSAKEHLEFYARIKGIPAHMVKEAAHWASQRLGLMQCWKKPAGTYSGGNKRKLSTAIALIGNPAIIFLDEPTTGMDPQARRFLWNCINNIVKSGRSVILTSHSMEECEALCSRLAIMVNGSFQCLGSIQHLKSKFGNGYTVILRISNEGVNLKPIMRFVKTSFPVAKLKERHHNMLQYHLASTDLSLSQLFHAMEEAKEKFGVEDYSVSQTTLDQVFVNFAKQQKDLLDQELAEKAEEENRRDSTFDPGTSLGQDDLEPIFAPGSLRLRPTSSGAGDDFLLDLGVTSEVNV